jgi:hypothetical protein
MPQATLILSQPAASAAPHPADGVPRCPRCHQATLDYSSVTNRVHCATCRLWIQLTPAQNDDYCCILTGIDQETDPSLFLAALAALAPPGRRETGSA